MTPSLGCTALVGGEAFCQKDVPAGAPVSLCGKHLIVAYNYCRDSIAVAESPEPHAARIKTHNRKPRGSVVYYIRRGDWIKIGTTTNFLLRMTTLMPDRILAVEPGGLHRERERHQQFARSVAPLGREYFRQTPDLLAHVAAVAAEHGAPPVTLAPEYNRWQVFVEKNFGATATF